MKILYTAFKGNNNASKILLDNISCQKEDKLYITNSYKTSKKELLDKIKEEKYDLIISFGRAPLRKNTIKIETQARKEIIYKTQFDYIPLKEKLKEENYKVVISSNAGHSYCNHIYYEGLKYIEENHRNSQMIFIHIPKMKNIDSIENLANLFSSLNIQNPFYTYIIRCEDNSLYTGITNDIQRRFEEHRTKSKKCAKYTYTHNAKNIEGVWQSANRVLASKLEYHIKRLTKKQKEELIKKNNLGEVLPQLEESSYHRVEITKK